MTRRQAAGKVATIHTLILGDTGLPRQGLAGEFTPLPHSSPLISTSVQHLFRPFVLQFLLAHKLVSLLCGLGWIQLGTQCVTATGRWETVGVGLSGGTSPVQSALALGFSG